MKRNNLMYAIAGGMLLGLGFPPYPFFLLPFIAFIPIFFLFDNESETKYRYKYLYLTFFVFHGLANWWISSWRAETDPYLMASGIVVWLAHPFVFMLPFVAYFFIKKHLGKNYALAGFPFFWVTFEWLHSLGEVSFPWLTIGTTQIYNHYWTQFIDITGVWGGSFLIVLTNVVIYKMIQNNNIYSEKLNFVNFFLKKNIRFSIALLLIIILPVLYGYFKIQEFDHTKLLKENKTLNVGVIQPNIDPWQKWASDGFKQIELHQALQDSLVKAHPDLDLCIWSETAIPSVSISLNQGHNYTFLQDWLDLHKVSLLTGFSEYHVYEDSEKAPVTARAWVLDSALRWEPFNAALLLNPKPNEQLNPQLYRKMRLTPFAERLPYAEKFTFAQKWFQWGIGISSWGIGNEQHNLKFQNNGKNADIGSVICIESIYPRFVSRFTQKGAGLLVVITNDGWYDFTIGPEQHYQIAAVRAIENRRYIARAANTGVSGFITPTGISLLKAKHYEPTAIATTLPILTGESLYVQYGDWLPLVSFFISILLLTAALIYRMQRK